MSTEKTQLQYELPLSKSKRKWNHRNFHISSPHLQQFIMEDLFVIDFWVGSMIYKPGLTFKTSKVICNSLFRFQPDIIPNLSLTLNNNCWGSAFINWTLWSWEMNLDRSMFISETICMFSIESEFFNRPPSRNKSVSSKNKGKERTLFFFFQDTLWGNDSRCVCELISY